ncbi:MAG: hypothetical protein HY089_03160 [Ignavibacteriales bacterium]|nr:hypothetical protein [Ignavibacteriales bacterium]
MDHVKHEECFNFISEILTILKSTNQPEKVLHLIVHRLVKIFKCQTCAVVVVNPNTEYLNVFNRETPVDRKTDYYSG